MRRAMRHLTVLAAIVSLLTGVWLPADSGGFVDSDGICGPVLAQGHAVARVAAGEGQAAQKQHCLFCHWRQTMSSAAATAFVVVAGPVDAGRAAIGRPSPDPTIVEVGVAAPRGPPAIS